MSKKIKVFQFGYTIIQIQQYECNHRHMKHGIIHEDSAREKLETTLNIKVRTAGLHIDPKIISLQQVQMV